LTFPLLPLNSLSLPTSTIERSWISTLVDAADWKKAKGIAILRGEMGERVPSFLHGLISMRSSLPVVNLAEATFECIFGRGCEGICCQNGRPPVYPEETERLDANLEKFLPHLRPEARQLIEKQGYLSQRRKLDLPMLRVQDSWCVFFNQGCVLHKVGAAEGDSYRYKPAACALFPLARNDKDEWYVRQDGYEDEKWKLFCLDPRATSKPAAESLQEELRLAERYTAEQAAEQAERAAG
jgi:Fe-S-cluster containining protein